MHFSYTQALMSLKYILVIWLGVIFSNTQAAVIFGDQDISKCSYNPFLEVVGLVIDFKCHSHDIIFVKKVIVLILYWPN